MPYNSLETREKISRSSSNIKSQVPCCLRAREGGLAHSAFEHVSRLPHCLSVRMLRFHVLRGGGGGGYQVCTHQARVDVLRMTQQRAAGAFARD